LKIPNIQYPISLLHSSCRIHNGAPPQSNPTLAVCLDADRLDLGRVGITPDPQLLSTTTAREMAKLGTISKSQAFYQNPLALPPEVHLTPHPPSI
jgi:hypothetical protein